MTPIEFEDYLVGLTNTQYDALIQERIARLAPEQQIIAQDREVQRKYRFKLMEKLASPDATEEDHESVYNALREGTDNCEHGRSICKHCLACGEMDHLMFPELFNPDGLRFGEDDE